ncbi:MAG TPA: PIG-L deacetylase family protein [Hyphomicrobiaceae bacterium]|jgi:LmbE family N-acetylglucosaminyl deacetylase|nr:PIG-L deacetylase family protein [Hyphomicrobiaceae bacterium]
MIALSLNDGRGELSVLCLGAHSDDIEIGAGGALLAWLGQDLRLHIQWCVLSADGERETEARGSAEAFLDGAVSARVEIMQFRTSFFPAQSTEIKVWFEELKARARPDLILTHRHDDLHQDHREVSRHTWATFRDQLILEYEIPKWDGDVGRPNLYVPIPAAVLERKIRLLLAHFGTQARKDWFDAEVFRGLARLRGMECGAPERFAEAFVARRVVLR